MICLAVVSRVTLSVGGYGAPAFMLDIFNLADQSSPGTVYFARLWAGRDIVLGLFLITARRSYVLPALLLCVCVECFDLVSIGLAFAGSVFTVDNALSQSSTVFAALVPELIAVVLIARRRGAAALAPVAG